MTNPWPNPSDWVSKLANDLSDVDQSFSLYEQLRTGKLKLSQDELDQYGVIEPFSSEIPHHYARYMTRLIDALERLPPFKDGKGLSVLKAIRLDLQALDEGSRPVRLEPRQSISTGAMNYGRRLSKAYAVACVRMYEALLNERVSSNLQARLAVVDAFKRNGLHISANTLFKWTEDVSGASAGQPNYDGRRLVERKLKEWKADPAWPFTMAKAEQVVEAIASSTTISLAHTT